MRPGMHQSVEDSSMNYNEVMLKITAATPKLSDPMMGLGKKCYVRATLKKEGRKIVVDLFTESSFGPHPASVELGYTKDEANRYRGVCVTEYETPSDGPHGMAQGELMDYEDFAAQHIDDNIVRIKMDRVMDDMDEATVVTDRMVDIINNIWENRDPGKKDIWTIQYN